MSVNLIKLKAHRHVPRFHHECLGSISYGVFRMARKVPDIFFSDIHNLEDVFDFVGLLHYFNMVKITC